MAHSEFSILFELDQLFMYYNLNEQRIKLRKGIGMASKLGKT